MVSVGFFKVYFSHIEYFFSFLLQNATNTYYNFTMITRTSSLSSGRALQTGTHLLRLKYHINCYYTHFISFLFTYSRSVCFYTLSISLLRFKIKSLRNNDSCLSDVSRYTLVQVGSRSRYTFILVTSRFDSILLQVIH